MALRLLAHLTKRPQPPSPETAAICRKTDKTDINKKKKGESQNLLAMYIRRGLPLGCFLRFRLKCTK